MPGRLWDRGHAIMNSELSLKSFFKSHACDSHYFYIMQVISNIKFMIPEFWYRYQNKTFLVA